MQDQSSKLLLKMRMFNMDFFFFIIYRKKCSDLEAEMERSEKSLRAEVIITVVFDLKLGHMVQGKM